MYGVWSGGCCRDRHRQHGASGLDEKKTTFINYLFINMTCYFLLVGASRALISSIIVSKHK